jgi:fatty acid desaturase
MTPKTRSAFAIPSRLNTAIILAQLGAIGGCLYAAGTVGTTAGVLLLAGAFALVMNSVYATIHEAEHRMLFPGRWLNDAAGTFMALFFPAPFHLLRQGHLGHHQRNRSDDEAFDFFFEGEHPFWKWMQLYGTLTGFYWVMVVLSNMVVLLFPFVLNRRHFEFDRPSAAFMDSLNPRYNALIRLEALAVIGLHGAIVWFAAIPLATYAVMYAGFGFTWSAMQYVHHFGTTRHVLEGARNLWIGAPIDAIWLNHNWHLTHHKHPTVPWIHLPRVGRREDPQRGFLPLHYLRMWRGPRRATEHVENRYAGRVIR